MSGVGVPNRNNFRNVSACFAARLQQCTFLPVKSLSCRLYDSFTLKGYIITDIVKMYRDVNV